MTVTGPTNPVTPSTNMPVHLFFAINPWPLNETQTTQRHGRNGHQGVPSLRHRVPQDTFSNGQSPAFTLLHYTCQVTFSSGDTGTSKEAILTHDVNLLAGILPVLGHSSLCEQLLLDHRPFLEGHHVPLQFLH